MLPLSGKVPMNALVLTCVVTLSSVVPVLAQAPPPAGQAAAPQRLVSPEVRPDRTITFRLAAPKATDVQVRFGEGAPAMHPMARGADGVWSVTVGPVEPEIHVYSFLVDGLKVLDLANPQIKAGLAIDANVVEVPGTPPRFDEQQRVAHGAIAIQPYFSSVQGRHRALHIYVPPQYYSEPARTFPVLYLWHGGGGVESDWSRDGRAGVILDNLIAQQRAVPMIIVMPNNNVLVPVQGGNRGSSEVLERELFTDIMPLVETRYRARTARNDRAIAGLSAGGGTTFNVGMRRLDLFAYLGEFSSGIFGGSSAATAAAATGAGYPAYAPESIAPGIYKNLVAPATSLKVFWMSVGTDDPRLPFQQQALADFQAHGIQPTFRTYAGAHEWKVWRHSLADFVTLLFR
jgi:enterochelin esterase family protein